MQAHLYLSIQGQHYALTFLSPQASVALTAWRLTKDGAHRDVRLTLEGRAECDCGDYVHRKERLGQDCKHISALRHVHLLPSE